MKAKLNINKQEQKKINNIAVCTGNSTEQGGYPSQRASL